MMNIPLSYARQQARTALVAEHIRFENEHDLEGVLGTFGQVAQYDDEAWDEHYVGREGVRLFYEQLMRALPDARIQVQNQHATSDAIVVEVTVSGTHLGGWRGLPATGLRVTFPLCGIFTFDDCDRLTGERIYYDRATVLRQLGVFYEPSTLLGQICLVITHPITILRVMARMVRRG